MKLKLFILFTITVFLLGCSCTREQLGISNLEWSSYSENKRKVLLTKCDQVRKARKDTSKKYKLDRVDGEFLVVEIFDGKVMFPPDFIGWQKYYPIEFMIGKGECRNVEIKSLASSKVKTLLDVCYLDNKLYLDPSCYNLAKKMGTVNIPYSPLWSKGFLYKKINSTGYVKLNDVMVRVNQQRLIKVKK